MLYWKRVTGHPLGVSTARERFHRSPERVAAEGIPGNRAGHRRRPSFPPRGEPERTTGRSGLSRSPTPGPDWSKIRYAGAIISYHTPALRQPFHPRDPLKGDQASLMGKTDPLTRVLESGIVAVIRAEQSEPLVDVAEALYAGGVEVMEVTFTVPQPVQVLESVARKLGDKVLLGAGTILDAETARAALLAGAEFIVAPNTNREVIQLCRRYGKLVMPGAMTPTEVVAAWEAGADIVKIFPSDVLGPQYLKALRGPLPQIRLMPTGGVNLETATSFLAAGACALGIGGSLVEPQAVAGGDMGRIEHLARQYVSIVSQFRARQSQASSSS
jgi:2-dehydro-3-deoxyphosphogluconate aldolase / (4S)-4-hydroxy-2-oxoglutarate aldolase